MNLSNRLLPIILFAIASAAYLSAADLLPGHHKCPHCQVIEETVYKDVITHRCKLHPDVKQTKNTVYDVNEVPFCLHKYDSRAHRPG